VSKPTISAERNLLGAAMHDPHILDEHGASLNDADWYRPQHGALWRRLTALRADPQHARTETGAWTALVLHEAYTWGQEVDGAAYVAAMVAAAPDVDSAAYFMRVIQSSSLGRNVRDVASTAMHQIDEGRPAAEVLAGFEAAIATLAARASVQASPWVPIGDVAAEVYDETQEAARNPESRIKRVVPTPWPTINLRTRGGLRRGEMAILAGRPGTGKTAAAMQMAEHAALYGGVGVFSMEMTRHALTTRELAREGRVDLTALTTGRLSHEQWAGLTAGVEVLQTRPIWIDDTPALHIAQMRARAKRLAERAKREGTELRTLVVDYVQLATATVAKGRAGRRCYRASVRASWPWPRSLTWRCSPSLR
jgi:replicative DNA helicase